MQGLLAELINFQPSIENAIWFVPWSIIVGSAILGGAFVWGCSMLCNRPRSNS
jgi:hypothetical protein